MAGADDVERLHERDAGGHHRGELAREDGDVAGRDPALLAKQHALLAHARRYDALAAQLGADRGLARRDDLAFDLLAGPVRAFPRERGLGRCCGCHVFRISNRERVAATGPSAAQVA